MGKNEQRNREYQAWLSQAQTPVYKTVLTDKQNDPQTAIPYKFLVLYVAAIALALIGLGVLFYKVIV